MGWLRRCGEEGMTLVSGAHLLVREKRQGAKAKYTNPKGKHIRENMPTTHRPSGPAGEVVAYGARWASMAGPGPVEPDFKRRFPTVMIFKFPMDFGIWVDFGNLHKDI
jgi:hypothetical protein